MTSWGCATLEGVYAVQSQAKRDEKQGDIDLSRGWKGRLSETSCFRYRGHGVSAQVSSTDGKGA